MWVLDYGAGNVRSVINAINALGFEVKFVKNVEDIVNAPRLLFPGVGAFGRYSLYERFYCLLCSMKCPITAIVHLFYIHIGVGFLIDNQYHS